MLTVIDRRSQTITVSKLVENSPLTSSPLVCVCVCVCVERGSVCVWRGVVCVRREG